MRLLVGIFTLVAITSTASAGENGSYLSCTSESGKTVLNIGNIGSALNPRSVQLTIEEKTLGNLEVGSVLEEIVVGKLTMYKDIAQGEIVLATVVTGENTLQVIKGIDPRKGKELDFNIDLLCATVENPI